MNAQTIQCPRCKREVGETSFNQPDLTQCPSCGASLQVQVFPALFRRFAPGTDGELLMVEGESSCFYHPKKKAEVPCDACGRFMCGLCDCQVKGQHLCPACLESGHRKKTIQGMEDMRMLHRRQAFVLALIPFLITGIAAIYMAIRYRKEPGSLVSPMHWAVPASLILGSLQILGYLLLIVLIVKS